MRERRLYFDVASSNRREMKGTRTSEESCVDSKKTEQMIRTSEISN